MSDGGSEGSPPRPVRRKIKKVMVLSSATESDSDGSVVGASTRRKRMRVLSDDGNSSSSSGSAVGTRRRRALPALRDTDGDSDSSGWGSDRSTAPEPSAGPSTSKPASGFASDSSEGNSDKCSICLLRFKEQEVGTPEACEHIFCLDCITEWSKNVNTCPVDRLTFNSIVVRTCAGGRVLRTEPVKVVERRPSVEIQFIDDTTPCEVCGRTDQEENMLLCDGCNHGYHIQCLTPPLTQVPQVEQWLCPNCDDLLDIIHLSELEDLFSEIDELDIPDGPRMVSLRQPRNVRRSDRSRNNEPSTSSGNSSSLDAPSTSRGTRTSRSSRNTNSRTTVRQRATGAKRRRYKRRTRTVVIEYEVQENGKFPVTKTVKRKIKKKKGRGARLPRTAARRSHVRAAVRARLAAAVPATPAALGAPAAAPLAVRRQRAGIPTLSLFGDPNQLDYFDEEDEEAGGGAATVVAVRPTPSIFSAYRQARRKTISIPSPPHASAAPDLLADILESQALLHAPRSRRRPAGDGRASLEAGPGAGRQAPAYPGHGARQAGGWGGGYRGGRVPPAAPTGHDYSSPARSAPRGPFHADYRRDDYGAEYQRYGPPRPPHPPEHYRARRPPPAWRAPPARPPPRAFAPLPEPPVFRFDTERDDDEEPTELVIDTDKYDPTEPTQDDDDESEPPPLPPPPPPPAFHREPTPPPPAEPAVASPVVPAVAAAPTMLGVSASALDSAVRAVLQEHRSLLSPHAPRARGPSPGAPSDDDDDGDCPNFAIYSATSVHIATALQEPPAPPAAPAAPRPRDDLSERVSKRCPITASTRSPIKIKLTSPALVKRPLTLYDDDEAERPEPEQEPEPDGAEPEPESPEKRPDSPPTNEDAVLERENDIDGVPDEQGPEPETGDGGDMTPELRDSPSPEYPAEDDIEPEEPPDDEPELEPGEDTADDEGADRPAEEPAPAPDAADDALEKMTESISETEDERSYTPCLDENKSKDTSLETDRDKGIEGLDTEMISEEEGHGMFSDEENRPPERGASPAPAPAAAAPARKRRKDAKRDAKEKKTKAKKTEVAFKKLSKSGKERNYRDKERGKRERRESSGAAERRGKRREKRKDLERYDVRSVVTEKRKRTKDAFGRDVSPRRSRSASPGASPPAAAASPRRAPRPRRSATLTPRRRSFTPRRKSITPRRKSVSPIPPRRKSISPRRRSISPRRRSISPRRRSISPRRRSISPRRRSISPRRRSISPRRKSITPRKRSISPRRRSISPRRRSITPRRRSITPRRKSITPRRKSISPRRKSISPRRKSITPRRKSITPRKKSPARRRRSVSRGRKRRRSATKSPKPKSKKKKRPRSTSRPPSRRRKSPKRKRGKRARSPSPDMPAVMRPGPGSWSPPSVDSRLLSPQMSARTPGAGSPPPPPPPRRAERRRRARSPGPCKEVFTSGDNILVSVSFKDQERDPDAAEKRKRREAKRDKRRKRRRAAAAAAAAEPAERAKPVAIIDLERSPFRELTPSPKNVIVLSDSEHGEAEAAAPAPEPEQAPPPHVGPKTPPEPTPPPASQPAPEPAEEARGPSTPPDSPDAYDPFEPTRSASPSPSPAPQSPAAPPPAPAAPAPAPAPAPAAAEPARTTMTLEAAQKTNLSADDVIDRQPISPIEKVMALLQSTRDVSPEPPPESGGAAGAGPGPGGVAEPPAPPPTAAAPPRIVLPSPTRSQPPKLFLAKPSPIKSNPVKPMQATKISRLPLPMGLQSRRDDSLLDAESPYSPGSSDFGDLFEPPAPPGKARGFDALFDKPKKHRNRSSAAKVPVKLNKKKGNKTQVGVKIDEDNLKILDDLPSSAVEMQVKSKFLKKLNRQERVVEEVKLVLKPHYNKKHVTKEEYKHILRRAVPKICHNKSGEINPTKIQALVEAYVKKFRKKHKLGLV